ncbi:hypothetical protein [Brevundimonas sp. SL161]|uniref:hypothetical protein n=1 Tax=Brevundimonas sp. SL161 TaxID=2804613 RepID=UPI003CEB94BF
MSYRERMCWISLAATIIAWSLFIRWAVAQSLTSPSLADRIGPVGGIALFIVVVLTGVPGIVGLFHRRAHLGDERERLARLTAESWSRKVLVVVLIIWVGLLVDRGGSVARLFDSQKVGTWSWLPAYVWVPNLIVNAGIGIAFALIGAEIVRLGSEVFLLRRGR